MFSVTKTGTNLLPLWTANVWPTNSGKIVDRRDQVLITFFCPVRFSSSTFWRRWGSANGPFLSERAILPVPWLPRAPLPVGPTDQCRIHLRRLTMNLSVLLFFRVL